MAEIAEDLYSFSRLMDAAAETALIITDRHQQLAALQAHVNDAHARFPDNKIVITEFALQNPPGGQVDQLNFFREAFAFLDSAAFIEMYFPFVATSPSLFQSNDPNGARFVGTGSTLYNDHGD
ncbi:hypothetical protein B0H19DRAFT_1275415 [Mycena capillaripes]|nr:hypothetical protein B0H19DRAFT_1275415 [Mycena capillaripes]